MCMSYRLCWLLASTIRMELFHPDPASKQSAKPIWHKPIAVYTVLDSWWWTEKLSETCRVLFQKYIWEINASCWFYNKNISRYTVLWMSNSHHLACSESLFKLCSPGQQYGRRAVLNRIISINIFNHNRHRLGKQFYYFETNFDPELRLSSGHDDPSSGSKLAAT